MVSEHRRSKVHDLIHPVSNADESSSTRDRGPLPCGKRSDYERMLQSLPPLLVPDKHPDISRDHDSHERRAHEPQSTTRPREFGIRGSSSTENYMRKEDARYYPSPTSAWSNGIVARPRAAGNSNSTGQPPSCTSSDPRDSFSRLFHTCQTGPNALGSSFSSSQPSSSRQSSHPNSLGNISLNEQPRTAPSRDSSGYYYQSYRCSTSFASPLSPEKQSTQDAVMTLSMMGGRAQRYPIADTRRDETASNGYDLPSSAEPRRSILASRLYQGERLPSICNTTQDSNNLTSEPFRSTYEHPGPIHRTPVQSGPMFRDPFQPYSEDTTYKAQTSPAHSMTLSSTQVAPYLSNAGSRKRRRDDDDDGAELREVSPTTAYTRETSRYRPMTRYGPVTHPRQHPVNNRELASERYSGSLTGPRSSSVVIPATHGEVSTTIADEPSTPSTVEEHDPHTEAKDDHEAPDTVAPRSDRSFTCAFMGNLCPTPGDNPRKGMSDFFGRNKDCTAAIPSHLWLVFCRQHYQRVKYRNTRNGTYGDTKACYIEKQIEIFEQNLGEKASSGEPLVWHIQFQKSLAEAVRDCHQRVARGRDRLFTPTNDKESKLLKELQVALWMEDWCGTEKTSHDCAVFIRRMASECREADCDLIRVEFLPVKWDGKVRSKSKKVH